MKTIKIILGTIFIALILVMGYATFVEQSQGSSQAANSIYATSWFFVLWGMLALLSVIVLWKEKLYRRMAVCSLHASFLLILSGAAITWFTADEGQMHIRQGETQDQYLSKNGLKRLPFSLGLDSFCIEYYPGSQAPADFASYVSHEGIKTKISMNNIMQLDGYRLYQSSFDNDLQGTILSVRYDPYGTPITYLGYALLGLSMIWVLLSRKGEFRHLLRTLASQRTIVFLSFLTFHFSLLSSSASARSIPTINQEKAEQMARMQVIYNDRVAPFSTLAHDFLQKIYGKSSYKGLSAEQVVYGWMSRPDAWKDEPMIRIKDGHLRHQLGIEGQYASLAQLFDGNDYRLNDLIVANGNQSDKAIRELDEKVGLIIMLTTERLIQQLPEDVEPLSDSKISAEILYNTIPFSKVLFMFCLTLGFLSFFLMLYDNSRHLSPRICNLSLIVQQILLVGCLLFHLAGYCLRWYVSGRIPLGNGYETMQFLALSIMVITLLLCRRFAFVLPFGFLLSGFALLVSYLGQMNPQITHLMPVLSSPLLSAHVSIIMMSYALLAFMMLNGLYALIRSAFNNKADIETLTILSRLMLYPAVFFLAVGIFLGAIWANISWGRYWSWDPKEVWALITLMIYAVPFHRQSIPALQRPHVFHAYLVIAFLSVLMTYFGVNYFLGGMHSYA